MTTKIKEYYAKDEDELLDLITSEEHDNEGEWVIPKSHNNRICQKCGLQNERDSKFCNGCGYKFLME